MILRGRARFTAPREASLDDARRDLEAARALCESQHASSFFAALKQALNKLAASLGDRDAQREDAPAIAARLKGPGVPAPVCEAISRAFEACRRFAFLNSTDEAVLRRSLALTDEAFGGAV